MRSLAAILLMSALPASGQVTKPVSLPSNPRQPHVAKAQRIPFNSFRELEGFFDFRLSSLVKDVDQPSELMGNTRGVQMDDFGVVFTAEVSLVQTPAITPFMQKIPPELAARIRQFRVDRLPALKTAMKEMMRSVATEFAAQVPANQQVVVAVRLYYGAWENTTGMPKEITMRATRVNAQNGIVEMEER